jgi:hypothetical protein
MPIGSSMVRLHSFNSSGECKVLLGRSRSQAEKPEQQIPQTIQADDGRPEKDSEQGKRTHHGEHGAFAALKGEAFWSKLAKHDMQRGYDDEGDCD